MDLTMFRMILLVSTALITLYVVHANEDEEKDETRRRPWKPIRATNFFTTLGGVRFTHTEEIIEASPKMRYVFILVRNGMRCPDSTEKKTFPSDENYKRKWKPNRLTTDAKRLLHMVGRSLCWRYRKHLQDWGDNNIYVSSIPQNYGYKCAEELRNGLFNECKKELKIPVDKAVTFDKRHLFVHPEECPAYNLLLNKVNEVNDPKNKANWSPFYQILRSKIGVKDPKDDFYITTVNQVYWLYEIIDFEMRSKQQAPWWLTPERGSQLVRIAREYLREVIRGHKDMKKFLVGRMFQEVLEGYYSENIRMHIHVTDDRSFAAFKSILMNEAPKTPGFGEALILEVNKDRSFRVHKFAPIQSKFEPELAMADFNINEDFEMFSNYLSTQLDLPMNEAEWRRKCFDENYQPSLTLNDFPVYTDSPQSAEMETSVDEFLKEDLGKKKNNENGHSHFNPTKLFSHSSSTPSQDSSDSKSVQEDRRGTKIERSFSH